MQNRLLRCAITASLALLPKFAFAQLSITSNAPIKIDFDQTVAGVENGVFAGGGFSPSPAVGQLDSDAWSISAATNKAAAFGATNPATAGASWWSNGTQSTLFNSITSPPATGIWAYNVGTAVAPNIALGLQQTAADFPRGGIILKIINNTGGAITSLNIAYRVYAMNNQNRNTIITPAYSLDGTNYTPDATQVFDTQTISQYTTTTRNITTVPGDSIAPGATLLMQWIFSPSPPPNSPTTGFYDAMAIDDIVVTPTLAPEPAAMSLASAALVMLARRREIAC